MEIATRLGCDIAVVPVIVEIIVGMVMIVDPAHKDAALKLAREHGETAFEIGVVADKPSADAPGCVVANLDSWKL